MNKLQFVMLMIGATLVCNSLLVEYASAEMTLPAEWLANGDQIKQDESSEIAGTFKFEDKKVPIAGHVGVKCGLILSGTVGAGGKGEITSTLNLKKEERGILSGSGAGSECQTISGCEEGKPVLASWIEVQPIGLPWTTTLFLMENGEYLDLVTAKRFGFLLKCLINGILGEDECIYTDTEFLVRNEEYAVLPVGSSSTPNAKCTRSVEETGIIEAINEKAEIDLTNKELLTVF